MMISPASSPDRITPAHAGKRSSEVSHVVSSQDHPRTRGEKLHQCIFDEVGIGSPPHTRGKDVMRMYNTLEVGITPAHAGKSGFLCLRIPAR